MSILVDAQTRLLVQGITGREGTFHTEQAIAYGTQVVAGVVPGQGGNTHLGVPVFNTVEQAVRATDANTSVIYVPARFATDAILEAIDAGLCLDRLYHRGDSRQRYAHRQTILAGQADAAHRPQLPRCHLPRNMQDRHYAGAYP